MPPVTARFTGRKAELSELTRAMKLVSRRVALVDTGGQGGVGTSQLALAWAHRRWPKPTIAWWVRAAEQASVTTGLAALAPFIGLPETDDLQEAADAVVDHLNRRGNWLLLLDGARSPEDLRELLGRLQGGGQILITTRGSGWDHLAATVELGGLAADDAVALLRARTDSADEDAMRKVAAVLGGLPQALEQAAAYCVVNNLTLDRYLPLLERDMARLRRRRRTATGYPVELAATWLAHYGQIATEHVAAAQLLRLLAFLAPGSSPMELLRVDPEVLPRELARAVADPALFQEAVGVLRSRALVTIEQDGAALGTHRLAQDIARDQLDQSVLRRWLKGRLAGRRRDSTAGWTAARWASTTADLLAAALAPDQQRSAAWWARATELVPHAQACLRHAERLDPTSLRVARLRHRIVRLLDLQ